jgi:hypothetical protein
MLSPTIRIGDRAYDYTGPEPSELTYGMCLFEIWREIGWCLEHWTQVSLDERCRNQASGLIFNPVTHPMWTNIGKGYGAGLTKSVLRTLKSSRRLLAKAEKCRDNEQSQSFRRSAVTPLDDLPSPLSLIFRSARRTGDDEVSRTLSFMILLLQEYLNKPTHPGNARAHWTALSLRAIFEEHTDITVTVGRMEQIPSGTFCKCLAQINMIVGLNCDFRHFAKVAQETPADDPTLLKMKTALTLDLCEEDVKNVLSFSD